MTERAKSSLIERYLNGTYTPKDSNFNNIVDCWFLNGKKPNNKIRFIHGKIAEKFWISTRMEGESFSDLANHYELYKHWDELLINVFDVRFAIQRTSNSFTISTGRDDDDDNYFDSVIYTVNMVPLENINKQELQYYSQVGETTFIRLSNKCVDVCTVENMMENVCCRTALLYILCQAYVIRMKTGLDDMIYFGNRPTRKTKFLSFSARRQEQNLAADNLLKIENLYRKLTEFKIQNIMEMPLRINRIEDTANIWISMYNFFGIKGYIMELDTKMKDFKSLIDNANMKALTEKGNKIAYIAGIIGIAACAGAWWPIISSWF